MAKARELFNDPRLAVLDDMENDYDPEGGPASHDVSQLGASNTNTGIAGPVQPAGAFDANKFRSAWMSSSGGLDDFISANPSFASGVTARKDHAYDPSGRDMGDLLRDFGGENGHIWLEPGSGGGGAPAPQSTGGSPFQDQIRQLLLQQLGTMGKPVDENDPIIAGQQTAYRNERNRGADRERAALAERAAFNGLNSGGAGSGSFETGIQGINEEAGQDIAGNKADLMGKELVNRRQQLSVLLSMALQSQDAESARALQLQIAQMDEQLRRQGLNQRQYEYDDTTGRQISRDAEDDYRWRVIFGLGG